MSRDLTCLMPYAMRWIKNVARMIQQILTVFILAQIRTVLDCTSKKSESVLDKEVSKLIDLSHQLDREDVILTTPIIAAQAYYIIQNNDKSLLYCDRTINESGRKMRADDLTAYSVWKVALFLKAAIFVGTKKPDAAIPLYEQVAAAAAKRGDIIVCP